MRPPTKTASAPRLTRSSSGAGSVQGLLALIATVDQSTGPGSPPGLFLVGDGLLMRRYLLTRRAVKRVVRPR
jgi:hypothetical protein